MTDRIVKSLQASKIVILEESARDGAQARTIMKGSERVEVARRTASIFGAYGPDHLIFAAGFPTIGKMEFEAIRELVDQVDECQLVTLGRSIKNDVDVGLEAIKGAGFPRVSFIHPVSQQMASCLLDFQDQAQIVESARELAKYALDQANGVPVDAYLLDASNAAAAFVAEVINMLHEQGISTLHVCDGAGKFFPLECGRFFDTILQEITSDVCLGIHFHNDFNLGLSNVLEVLRRRISAVSTSWLGIAERVGMVSTEQLLFLLGFQPEQLFDRAAIDGEKLFYCTPELKLLKPIAETVSELTRVPLKVTDPIVGPGMNKLVTGSQFNDFQCFQPFDAEAVLGIPKETIVTHLVSEKILRDVAESIGVTPSDRQIGKVLEIVKTKPYETGEPVTSHEELRRLFQEKVEVA